MDPSDKMTEPRWFFEIKEGIEISKFLIELDNDAANRIAFILLDNCNELFIKYYVQNSVDLKKQKLPSNFYDLLSIFVKETKIDKSLVDDIKLIHKSRNNLYHDPTILTVSRKIIIAFMNRSIEMYNNVIKIKTIKLDDNVIMDLFEKKIYKQEWNSRYEDKERLADAIRGSFGLTPNDPVEILLGSLPYTKSGLDAFQTLFYGALERDSVNGVNVRVLEIVNGNDENSWHDFYISYVVSDTWYGIVKCFWSKWGEGKRRSIEMIYKMIKQNEELVSFRKEYRSYHHFWRGALDQFYLI